jgi:beta-galactosidase
VIDDWFTNRRLALVLEAKVGEGRLLLTSIDLATGLDENVVARQLRRSLLDYMATDRFAPTAELTPTQVRSLLRD